MYIFAGENLALTRRRQWLDAFYIAVKIVAAITATILGVYLIPIHDLGKGFALGALVSTFIWLFVYLYSRQRAWKMSGRGGS